MVVLEGGFGGSHLVALVSTFFRLFLVVGAYDLAGPEARLVALAAGLLSGLTYGLYSIFGKPLTRRLSTTTSLELRLGIGALLLFVAFVPTLGNLTGLSPSSHHELLFPFAAPTPRWCWVFTRRRGSNA
jgi:drug/metabolite transporter, DME family